MVLSSRVLALLLVFLFTPCVIPAEEPTAESMYHLGRRLEKRGKIAEAYIQYSQAAAADPSFRKALQRANALQTRAAMLANAMPSSMAASTEAGATADVADPDGADDSDSGSDAEAMDASPPTEKELRQAREPQPPTVLAASPDKKDFDIRGDSKAIYEQVLRAYGLDAIFDGDYQPLPNLRFTITQGDYRDALHELQELTGTFLVPISKRLVLVVKDTPQKRTEVENSVAISIPIPDPMTLQEAQELARSVQQVMEIQRFAVDSAHRVVYLRDHASKVWPAAALFEELLYGRPQVMIDVELLTVSKDATLDYGFPLPSSTGLAFLGEIPHVLTQILTPAMTGNLLTFGGGTTLFGIGITSVQAVAQMSKSNARSLFHSEIRSLDGQPANLHVGEKYPILSASYTIPPGSTPGVSLVPSFNFEDLGLVLKVTPKVHGMEDVTLEVEAEYKVLSGTGVSGIPIISNRKFVNKVRLTFDQAAIVGGLFNMQKTNSLSGVAGLGSVPLLGAIFSRTSREDMESETLLVLKPHLLNFPNTEIVTHEIWLGSEGRMRVPL